MKPYTSRRLLKAGSQADRILGWLKDGRTLTALQALRLFDCLSLSQRRSDLIRRGHDVRTTMVKVGGKRIAKYHLHGVRH